MKTVCGIAASILGLVTVTLFAGGNPNNSNTPAIVNFYGAPLLPTAPFYGLHADQPAPPPPAQVLPSSPTEDYVDGSQNVSAFFFATGNAGMQTSATSSQPTIRQLYIDLASPISVLRSDVPPFAASTTSALVSNVSLTQNMLYVSNGMLVCCGSNGLWTLGLPGAPPSPRYGTMFISWPDFTGRNIQWQLQWGPASTQLTLGSCLQTSVNSGGTVWTVNTVGYPGVSASPATLPPCTSEYDKAALMFAPLKKGNVAWTLQGYYHVPFSFVIQKK